MPLPSSAHSIELSVVIPFFNDAENVAVLIGEVARELAQLERTLEIVTIDDGSLDSTAEILRACARDLPGLKVFRHPKNRGQAAALWRLLADQSLSLWMAMARTIRRIFHGCWRL